MKTQSLSVDLLRIDGDTQSRLAINEDAVGDYAGVIAECNGSWALPPLDVFYDGTDYFMSDGFHRLLGAQRAKRGSVPCVVHNGTAMDARIFGMTANDKHGLRLSHAERRANVEWLLDNGGNMTQKAIAEKAGASRRFVQKVVADRNPASIAGKVKFPKQEEAHDAPSTPSGGASADPLPKAVEPCGLIMEPPTNGNGKPPKQYEPSAWFKQWEQGIKPMVKFVDKMAEGLGQEKTAHHKAVQVHLQHATYAVMEWLDVDKEPVY